MTATQDVGDRWAKNIAAAFLEWQKEVELEGRKNFPATKFDPSPFIEEAFLEGGEKELEEIGKLVGMGVSFDLKSPEAIAWLEKFCGDEIKYIDAGTKAGIRETILRGFQEGLSPNEQIKIIKQNVGLIPQHVQAVRNFEAGLEKLDMDESARKLAVDRYREKLLRWRAGTIALSEGHKAANEGYREANRGAVRRGILSPDDWVRSWLITHDERTCHICRGYEGATADLPDGQFNQGAGGGPIAHPRCRCCEILVPNTGQTKRERQDLYDLLTKSGFIKTDEEIAAQAATAPPKRDTVAKARNFTMMEKDSVDDYIRNDYVAINQYLRSGEVPFGYDKDMLDMYVKNIDSAIDKSAISDNITVYRGVSHPKHIENKGYTSTSMDRNIAEEFGEYVLEIKVPKGTKAIDVDSMFEIGDENEILLPRNIKLRTVSEEGRTIKMEVDDS